MEYLLTIFSCLVRLMEYIVMWRYSGIYLVFMLLLTLVKLDKTETKCYIVTLEKLLNADCNNLRLKEIPDDLDRDIKVLKFEENQLTLLKRTDFQRYLLLQNIDMTRNRINEIQEDTFRNLLNLQILYLEGNELNHIPEHAFQYLTSLRILNMKSNQIKHISNTSLASLVNIQELNLENNWIETIDSFAFAKLSQLYELNIVGNELRTLHSDMQRALTSRLNIVRLHKNPWHCDCHLRWLRDYLATEPITWKFYQNAPQCHSPPLISNASWKQLSAEQFACAAEIIVKTNSTSVVLTLGQNFTINCLIKGDPPPRVTWLKNMEVYPRQENIREVVLSKNGGYLIESAIVLYNSQLEDVGDYKCIAQNNGGRSEVTYTVNIRKDVIIPINDKKEKLFILGLSKEIFLAIFVSAGLVIIILFICIIACLILRQQKNDQRHKGRKERTQSKEKQINQISNIEKQTNPIYGKPQETKDVTSDRKLLLCEKKDPVHITTATKVEKDEILKPLKDEDKSDVDSEFKMKIFALYDEEEKNAAESVPVQEPKASETERSEQPESTNTNAMRIQRETPDLLKDRVITNRAIPVPPPSVPNHIAAADHPRAKENPYVTASEIKAVNMKQKTASADDLLDGRESFDNVSISPTFKRSSSRDDVIDSDKPSNSKLSNNQKRTRFREPLVRPKDHASTCMNPVCLKDNPAALHQGTIPNESTYARPKKPIYKYPKGHYEIDVDNMASADPRYDRYTTLPARGSKPLHSTMYSPTSIHSSLYSPPSTSQSSPAKSPVNSQRQIKPTSKRPHIPYKTVSFSEEGHPIIDLTREMPEPIVISGFRPSEVVTKRDYPDTGQYSSTMPRMPQNVHKSILPNGSPPNKPCRKVQCTTIDELLSPPFGQSPKDPRYKAPSGSITTERHIKPGEKDEFGTAV